jgi:hypothetical protein
MGKADGESFDFMLAKPFNLKELETVGGANKDENEAYLP